jgi:hypothetical protein
MPIENFALNPKPIRIIDLAFKLIILPTIMADRNLPMKFANRSHDISWKPSKAIMAEKLTLKPTPKKKIGPRRPYATAVKADEALGLESNFLRETWKISPETIAPRSMPSPKY